MRKPSKISITWPRLRGFLPLVVASVIGVGGSISAWHEVSLRDDQLAELDFNAHAQSSALILQDGINEYATDIIAVGALFDASQRVERDEFGIFTDRLLHDKTAILRVSWTPRVRRDERLAHEQEAAREGLTGYHIHDLAPERTSAPSHEKAEYFPVFYATGLSVSSPIYGLDIGSEPMRLRTLERARDTGAMATAANIVLDSTNAGDRNGFFVTLPAYRRGAPHDTLEDRRQNLVGFVNAVFQTGVMIDTIIGTMTAPTGLDFYLFAADPSGHNVPFHFHAARARSAPTKPQPRAELAKGLNWSSEIRVGNDRWVFVAAPIPGGPGTATHGRAWIVLIAGMLVSGLVVAYMSTSIRHARRLEMANEKIETQNTRFDAALNNMSEGLCMFDGQQRLLVSNARYAQMYGLQPDQVAPGTTLGEIAEKRVTHGAYAGEIPEEYARKLLSIVGQNEPTTRLQELNDGRIIAFKYQPLPDGGWVATHEDVTEQKRIQARIAYLAHHDVLTDLANRVKVRERLQQVLSRASPQDGVAVLCLDLDRFKEVNDALGHPGGDRLLKSVAERLRSYVGETDIIARLGGDEFAVIQIGSNQPMDAGALATRIIVSIGAPHHLDGQEVEVGASVGIAVWPTDGADPDELMRNAHLALYRAKTDGRGTHRFFEKGMDERMQARRSLERDLRRALTNGEFEVYYQPLINLQRNEVTGFEGLLRWNHVERGRVSPADFIPLAEETGLIVPIGAWVLRQACSDAASWPEHIKVAVNLSSVQFKGRGLVAAVFSALDSSGLAARRLELEITESVLLGDSERTLAMLHELRARGTRISLDDFGTGYSSLSYLQSFPFDKIKIDQSFIRNINENTQSLAIVHAVSGLGVSLGIATTAEGVETKEQLDRVRAEGCTEAQGYFFSAPKPASEVALLLSSIGQKSELAA